MLQRADVLKEPFCLKDLTDLCFLHSESNAFRPATVKTATLSRLHDINPFN